MIDGQLRERLDVLKRLNVAVRELLVHIRVLNDSSVEELSKDDQHESARVLRLMRQQVIHHIGKLQTVPRTVRQLSLEHVLQYILDDCEVVWRWQLLDHILPPEEEVSLCDL